MAKRKGNENPALVPSWDDETEIVVAGGGYAGLAASVAASERDASVILLEQRQDSLRPTGRGGRGFVGMFAVESVLQKREGIELTSDWAFKFAVDHAHWRCNAHLLRKITNNSADLIDWLIKQGVTFKRVESILPHYPRVWHYFGDQSLEVIRVLTKRATENRVKLMYQTRATEVITGPDGNIIGIKIMTGGQVRNIKARHVILATGGVPESGDEPAGMNMAEYAGAAIDYKEQYVSGFGITRRVPPELNEFQRIMEQPFLWVNKSGERVFDESYTFQPEMQNVAEFQKDRTLIQIFDEATKNNLINIGVKYLQHGTISQKLTKLDKQIEAALKTGLIEKASTVSDLASRIMVEPTVLEATINQYNEFCDNKHDSLFLKNPVYLEPVRTPPFYAIICDQQFHFGGRAAARRVGGVRINSNCQVLDSDNNVIRGLYAVGKDAADIYGSIYPAYLAGINLTFEIATGRMAGEHAVVTQK